MLTYEQFKKYMDVIIAADKKLDDILKVLGGGDGIFDCTTIGTTIELLSMLMDDSENWIGYWMYEQEHGTKWDEHTASEADGIPIICRTVRQLYDFLAQNAKDSNAV